ncbi:hypothetical protein Rsub_11718 [Raphidocelis subcapitata]|uniref:RecF/RecN/SMC N-terminal domain-containing protein n=1 Tax=Raphidocelis subcapitata TaxID=307507 RepID=A0A2V0PGN9_9CHLO|nr:hypothetical protein Rsub_11718 [Raphidocelis subcapitata]|eukprot:GBF98926.1 hypothetical protein Rsub_11718 [Raphidocelis subcapitata]
MRGGTPSWRLQGLSIRAFKSFGGATPAVFKLPPSAGVVCVLGANGSGKSALLEALCFALGAPASAMRVKLLREVVSTESEAQLCEVRVTLVRRRGGAEAHEVAATLSPEGARVFRIDGRVRNAAQVKAFLREGGLVVGPSTVIKQQAVTSLADSNAPLELADLVAAASGLARWREESKAAADEVRRARRALAQVQSDIGTLEAAVAADEAAAGERRRAAELGGEAARTLAALRRALARRRGELEAAAAAREAEAVAAEAGVRRAQAALQMAEQEADEAGARAQALQAEMGTAAGVGDAAGTAAEEWQLANAAAEVAAAAALLQAERDAEAALVTAVAASTAARAAAQLASERRAQLQQAAAAAEAGASGVTALRQQLRELEKWMSEADASASALRRGADAAAATLQQLTGRMAEARGEAQRADAAVQECSGGAAAQAVLGNDDDGGSNGGAARSLQDLRRALLDAERGALNAQRTAAAASADACAAAAASDTRAALPCGARRLADCFEFDEGRAAEAARLTRALAALCSSYLDVVVAPDAAAAAALLDAHRRGHPALPAGGKLRVWQLDRLAPPPDRRSAVAEARRALGGAGNGQQGRLVQPIELMAFEPGVASAVHRAFGGGLVVAADAASAGEAAARFGLVAATPAGDVHRRGSISGGGGGSSSGQIGWGAARFEALLVRDAAARAAREADAAAARACQEHAQLAARIAAAEELLALQAQAAEAWAAADAVSAECAAAEARLGSALAGAQQQRARHRSLEEDAARCRALLAGALNGAGGGSTCAGGAGVGVEVQLAELRQLLTAAQEREAAAAGGLLAAEAAEDHAGAALEVARLRAAAAPDAAVLAAQLAAAQRCLEAAHRTACETQARGEAACAANAAAVAREAGLREKARSAAAELRQLEKGAERREAQARAARGELASVARQLGELQAQWRAHAAWDESSALVAAGEPAQEERSAAAGGDGQRGEGSGGGGPGSAGSADELTRRLRRLRAQLEALNAGFAAAAGPGAAEAAAAAARAERLAAVRALAARLAAEVDALEGDVARGASRVVLANESAADDVASGFASMAASLLPSLELSLARVGAAAHEGLQIRYRPARSAPDAPWQTELGGLSGGQRTLVSLAALLAAARAAGAAGGGGGAALLLLDEVDGALDEQNQRRVAELLLQLAREGPAQVLAVSHHAAFQSMADGSLTVAPGTARQLPGGAGAEPQSQRQGGGKQRGGKQRGGKRPRVQFAVA